ncbi:MAG: metallophosphoesterase [Endomicrobia bacterium]|nr:metallophosphoesterase [Endomicrobiia bacterium]MCL2799017.1 metallophosphoesterase [Endomicrobiia bacterium]
MRILCVSDDEDVYLKHIIETSQDKLGKIDCIFSCGDLTKKYLEYITDGVNKNLYYVVGNHFVSQFYQDGGKESDFGLGGTDMHGRFEVVGNYIVVGFGGSKRYNPGKFQFEENEMEKIVRKTTTAVKRRRFFDLMASNKTKDIIVITHAPVAGVHDKPDRCHSGFECFRNFISEMKPLLWLHGHIHENRKKIQQTVLHNTLIVNAVPSKIIEINDSELSVRRIID